MEQFFYLLRDVIQLRRGPQDAPYSPRLLVGVCAAILLLQLAIAHLLRGDGETLGAGVIGLAFNLGLLHLLLNLRRLSHRFVQSALTWLGCAILFTLLSLPLILVLPVHPPTPASVTPAQGLAALAALAILIWKILVDAHVLRHALDLPFAAGLLIAVCWIVAELALSAVLGGGDAGGGA